MLKPLVIIALLVSSAAEKPPIVEKTPKELQESVREILSSSALSGSTTGLVVKQQGADTTLFSQNADLLLVPASTVKILTSSLALDVLGPDYRFVTELRGKLSADLTSIEGNLCVKGHGDPWLIPERLWYLTQRLKATGVSKITGDLVVDASYFDGAQDANGIEQDDSSSAYMAPAGAVSVGFNVVQIHIRPNPQPDKPAIIYTEPISDHLIIDGEIKTVANGSSHYDAEIEAQNDKSVLKLSGTISQSDEPRRIWRRITVPSLHAGSVLEKLLKETGIPVVGKVALGHCTEDSEVIADVESPRLADLISKVNKYSNNFMASQLARAVGAHIYGAPGTWKKGQIAMNEFLTKKVGLKPNSYQIENASGLHDVNKISVKHVSQLLEYIYNRPKLRIEFLNSLAVSGGTGTLEDRMAEAPSYGLVRGKTGTLSIASALSGYVTNPDGEVLVFSMVTNNYRRGISSILEVQDSIGNLLATTRLVRKSTKKEPEIAVNGDGG